MRRWVFRLFAVLVVLIALAFVGIWVIEIYPRHGSHPPLQLAKGTLAIVHARVYVSPDAPSIDDGTVLVRDGLIAAVGKGIQAPPDARVVPCDHCIVTAGFWNAHVHLTEPKWSMANWKSAETLNPQLADMFLSRGFTTVIDLGSNPADTFSTRRRIEKGELVGPYIYSAGTALYPPHGIPFYLKETLPRWIQALMPQPETPDEAVSIVRRNLASGADVTKLFTGSWVERGHVLPMPVEIARAAVNESHLNGKLVFAHPSDLAGTKVAIDSGVDILAHAADDTRGVDAQLLQSAINKNMAMIPTLKMFTTTVTSDPHYMEPMRAEVGQFHQLGGTLIFGTDVGYMTDYSTETEFSELGKSGLDFKTVLAMLTTNPASRMGVSDTKGTVSAGKLADLTILDADPATDLTNFSRVHAVIRSGKLIWQR
ncbi:MAG: amidohydrolase family protein [Acidobacteria bacterium]|nr:amidohydrolase family protein [Acidobacteriota bacterium]